MRLLDLFCGAGGAAVGYHRAGFDEIVGVDNRPQKNYPFDFVLADALEYVAEHGHEFDAIHASPPCQAYSTMSRMGKAGWSPKEHPELIEPTRRSLLAMSKPYVIENVVTAPLLNPTLLCGSSFGLGVRRHRLFETSFHILRTPCRHRRALPPIAVYGDHPERSKADRIRRAHTLEQGADAMGIHWMVWSELTQAIPPTFTEYIGLQLIQHIQAATEDVA